MALPLCLQLTARANVFEVESTVLNRHIIILNIHLLAPSVGNMGKKMRSERRNHPDTKDGGSSALGFIFG